jgi:cellobiose phosphorylase
MALKPGATVEVTVLGEGVDEESRARSLPISTSGCGGSRVSEHRAAVDERLSAVEIRTPDPALDLLVNRWLGTRP